MCECIQTAGKPKHCTCNPRPHAELIKAWADGADIQYLAGNGIWTDAAFPYWAKDQTFRIKPESVEIFYRRYLSFYPSQVYRVWSHNKDNLTTCADIEKGEYFFKWIDLKWQSFIVEGK